MKKLTKKQLAEHREKESKKINDSISSDDKSYLNRSIYDWITLAQFHITRLSIKDAFESYINFFHIDKSLVSFEYAINVYNITSKEIDNMPKVTKEELKWLQDFGKSTK